MLVISPDYKEKEPDNTFIITNKRNPALFRLGFWFIIEEMCTRYLYTPYSLVKSIMA